MLPSSSVPSAFSRTKAAFSRLGAGLRRWIGRLAVGGGSTALVGYALGAGLRRAVRVVRADSATPSGG
ncbi:MAG: hypothetical protein ABEJ73_12110 [Haloplanus sp.]